MPKVSVVIPVYGVEKYIERCAKSLFEQSLYDIEFIFVDDCTPDRSIDIVKRLLKEYPNREKQVTFLKMSNNSGLPAARKKGIIFAKGDYIANCDSDDWVEPQMYEKMYTCAIKEGLDIVYCDYYKSDGVNRQYVKQIEKERFMLGPVWNKIVKASLYKNDISFPTANKAEDGALMMQLSYYAKNRGHVEEALYYYFNNPASICRVLTIDAILRRHKEECENLDLRENFLRQKGEYERYKEYIDAWKFSSRRNLLPLVGQKEYYNMWINSFPEINGRLLLNGKLPLRSKILFLLVISKLYPMFKKLLNYK